MTACLATADEPRTSIEAAGRWGIRLNPQQNVRVEHREESVEVTQAAAGNRPQMGPVPLEMTREPLVIVHLLPPRVAGCQRIDSAHAAEVTGKHDEGDSQMGVRMVRAKIKPGKTDELEKATQEMFAAIEAAQPHGVRYASCKLPDGEPT